MVDVNLEIRDRANRSCREILAKAALGVRGIRGELTDEEKFCGLLQTLVSSRQGFESLVQESVHHDNGFIKMLLKTRRGDNHARVRLHVWDGQRNMEGLKSDVHNHTRDFCSVILAGKLVRRVYMAKSNGERYYVYNASNRGPSRAYVFKSLGVDDLMVLSEQVFTRGDVYAEDYATLHQIEVPGGELTATLFVQGPVRQDTTLVYAQRAKRESSAKPMLSEWGEIAPALETVLNSMECSHA